VYRPLLAALFVLTFALTAPGQDQYLGADISLDRGSSDLALGAPRIERVLTYQGILKDEANDPIEDGDYGMIFRLYDCPSGGSPLWTSPVVTLATVDGLFTVELGPIPLPFDTTYYLSLQVQGDYEMPGRQRLAAAPYSASALP